MNDIQVKSTSETVRANASGAGWENGGPTAIYHAQEAPLSVQLIRSLIELGATIPMTAEIIEQTENILDLAGDQRAVDCLARFSARLDGTKDGAILARAISGNRESLRVTAKRAGVSHPALLKRILRIRAKAGLPTPAIGEGQ